MTVKKIFLLFFSGSDAANTLRQIRLYYSSRLQTFFSTQITKNNQLGKTQNPADIQKIQKAAFFERNLKIKIIIAYKKSVNDLPSLGTVLWQKTKSCFGEVPRKEVFTYTQTLQATVFWNKRQDGPVPKQSSLRSPTILCSPRTVNVILQYSL